MSVEHVAIWTQDLERLCQFYERYFGARAGRRYASRRRPGFESYFLTFPGGGARLELMTMPDVANATAAPKRGYAHIALAAASRAEVESLAARMRSDGVRVVSAPRETGDGYFEAVVEDPDGNEVEIVGG